MGPPSPSVVSWPDARYPWPWYRRRTRALDACTKARDTERQATRPHLATVAPSSSSSVKHVDPRRSVVDRASGTSPLSGPLPQQPHRGRRRCTEAGRLVPAGAFGGGIEVHDTHIRVRVEPGEQLSQARSPIAAAAVGRLCADVEHVPLSSADIVGAGSAGVAAAQCSTHNTSTGCSMTKPANCCGRVSWSRNQPAAATCLSASWPPTSEPIDENISERRCTNAVTSSTVARTERDD